MRDARVVAQINAQVGQRLVMHYEEHRGLPTSCFGETAYFVDRVQAIGDVAPAGQSAPSAAK